MTAKDDVRARIRAGRSALSEAERAAQRARIVARILPELADRAVLPPPGGGFLARSGRIAAYEPLRTEPGSVELLAALTDAGWEVLVPVTLPDRDLDWRVWRDDRLLGPDAVASAALVLVPAFAVDAAGNRLGRGGGSYDRALTRVPAGVPVVAVLFRGEVLDRVPTDAWDRPVTAAVTPDGWRDFTPGGRRNSP